MIEVIKELIALLGTTSPILYIFAVGYVFGKILSPVLIFSFFIYAVRAIKECTWWMVRDEIVKRIRNKNIVVDGADGVDEDKR